ncbi:potassium channel subfamily k member 18-like isoform x2 [Plakobranchus ocellatus]|uniref:Potassium channel subfamily k member 18-like isoform x2 n=1 Tax=Plakobranchus ocellatus TaxID=259542 RepID=A0AAV4CM67_9GAST|nr:potassium channel subfamily k member 18-like isoform x2 [Plakobranchus ocellatus]
MQKANTVKPANNTYDDGDDDIKDDGNVVDEDHFDEVDNGFTKNKHGWGNIVPITAYGRMATILYGFVGIPLLFTLSSEVGNFTTKLIRLFTNLLARMCICIRQEDKSVNRYLNRDKYATVDTDLAIRLDTKGALDSGYNHPPPDGHPAPAPRRYSFTEHKERAKPVSKSGLKQDWRGGGDYNVMANKNSSYLNSVVSTLDFLLEASLDPSAWKHGQGMCKDKDDAQVKIGDSHGGKESFQHDSWKSRSPSRYFEKPHYRLKSTEDAVKMSEAFNYLTLDEFCRIMKFVGFDFDKEVLEKSHAVSGNGETTIHRLARKKTPERKLRRRKDKTREGQGGQRGDNSNPRTSSKSRATTSKTFETVKRKGSANGVEKEVQVIGRPDEGCTLQTSDVDHTRPIISEAKENFEYYHKNFTENEERKEKNKQKIKYGYQNVSDTSEKTSSSLGRESYFQTGHREESENRTERRKIPNVKNFEDKEVIYHKNSSLHQLIGSGEKNTRAEHNEDIGFSRNALRTGDSPFSIERRATSEDRLKNKAMHCISKPSVPLNEFPPQYSVCKQGCFQLESAAYCSHPTQVVGKSLGAADRHLEHLVNPYMETCYESTHPSFHDALSPLIITKATAREPINVSNVMLNDCVSQSESNDQDFCDDDIHISGHFDIFPEKSESVTARDTECLVNTGPGTGRKVNPLVNDSVLYEKTSFQMMQVKREQKYHKGCSEENITSLTTMCSGRKDLKHQSSAEFLESENPVCQRSMRMDPLRNGQRPQSNSLLLYEQISQPHVVRPESVTPEKKHREQCSSFHYQSERGQQLYETGSGDVMHAENKSRFTNDETLIAETFSSLAELVDRNLIHTKSPVITSRGNLPDLINQKSSESVITPFHNSAIPATSRGSNLSILGPKDQILDLTEPEKTYRDRSPSISEEESLSSRPISALEASQGMDETRRYRFSKSGLLTQIATEFCLRRSPNVSSLPLEKPFTQNIPAVNQILKRRNLKNRYKKSSIMSQVDETIDRFVCVTDAIQINDQSSNVSKLLHTSTTQKKTDIDSSLTQTKCQKVQEGVRSYSLPQVASDNPNEFGIKDQPDSHISYASGDSKLPKELSRRGHVRRQLCKKWVEQSYPFVYENERRKIEKAKINCSSEGLPGNNIIRSVAMVTEPKKTSENDLREMKKNSKREIKASPTLEFHHVKSGSARSNYRRLYTKQWVDMHSLYTEEMNVSMQQTNKPNASQTSKKSYFKQNFSKDARRCLSDNPPNVNNGMRGETRQVDETLDYNRQNNVLYASDVKSYPIETSEHMGSIHDFNMSNLHGKESSTSATRKKSVIAGKSLGKKLMSRVSKIIDRTNETESGDTMKDKHAFKPTERKKYRVDRFAMYRPKDKRTLREDLALLKERLGNVASSVASGEYEEVELPLICIYIGMGLFMAFGAFMNYVVNKDVDDWFVSIYFVYALCSTTGFGDILPQPESYAFHLFYGLAGVSMFNIVVNATLQYMMSTIDYLKIYFKSSS